MPLSTLDPVAALIVVDLQDGTRTAPTVPHGPDAVIARSAALADAFRARGLPVVLVRVSLDGVGFSPGRTDLGAPVRERPAGFDRIVDELAGHPGDVVVTKRSVGAFVGTDLDLVLRRRGVTQVVLTGLATSMGVEGTARAGHDLGYHVVVVTDAVADRDEAAHRHSVTVTFPRLAETTTTTELLEAVGVAIA